MYGAPPGTTHEIYPCKHTGCQTRSLALLKTHELESTAPLYTVLKYAKRCICVEQIYLKSAKHVTMSDSPMHTNARGFSLIFTSSGRDTDSDLGILLYTRFANPDQVPH